MSSYDPFPEKLPSITMLNQQGNDHNNYNQNIAFSNFASNSELYANNAPSNTTNDMSLDLYNQQHLSPPLTPAVSPSNMMDPMQFKRKYSVDVGPFGLDAHSSLMHDHDAYRRSSCSVMSIDNSLQQQDYSLEQQQDHPFQQQMIHHHNQQQSDYHHHYHHQAAQQDHSYFIGDSPSLSDDIGNAVSTAHDSTNINSDTTKIGKRRLGQHYQQGPNAPHKHVCKYTECGWSFKRYEHLKRHMLVHTGERPHVCAFPGCGKSFSRSDNFHAHYRTHTKKQSGDGQSHSVRRGSKNPASPTGDIYLPMTGSPSSSSSSTSSQQDLIHGFASSQPFAFNNKSFELPYQNMYDQRSFTNEVQDHYSSMTSSPQPYMPSQVGVSSLLNHDQAPSMFTANALTSLYDLQGDYTGFHSTTTTTTTDMPPPPSPTSPSTLVSPGSITSDITNKKQRKHRTSLSHTINSVTDGGQQKSHVCPVTQCQRRFKRLEHLKRHMRIHTLERPFACTFPKCHKHFSRSDNLSQHMKTHQHRPGQDKRRNSSTVTATTTSSSSSVSPRTVMDDFASSPNITANHPSYSTTDGWTSSESVGC